MRHAGPMVLLLCALSLLAGLLLLRDWWQDTRAGRR